VDIISEYGNFTLYRKNSDQNLLKDQLQKNPRLTELNALLDEAEKREHTSRDEIIDNLFDSGKLRSKMHGAFMVALANLPSGINSAARSDTWSTRLRDVKDSAPQSWIAELIQNARDAGASEIEIEMFDDSLKFSHNGEDFKATELVALISISSTTKSGNVASIGQFGVGFKYWTLHFENLEVRVNTENDKTLHSLSLKYDLTSTNSIYQTMRSTREEKRTEFIFTNPKDKDGWKDFVSPNIEEILGTRISNSLPMLQTDDRTLVVRLKQTKSGNEELREYSCKIKEKLASSYDDLSLERISYGLINENKEFIRARMSLSNIIKIHDTKIGSQCFLDLYLEELMNSQTTQNLVDKKKETIEETARNIAERALEETYVTILLTPEEDEGAISRLFVAEQINNVTFAFIADAPWMLSDDRHNWASITYGNKNKEWNQFISRFVNKLYSLTVKEILKDEENFGLNHSEMYEILNRPFGIDNYKHRYNQSIQMSRFDWGLKIKHLIDTLEQPDKEGFTEALCFIWRGIKFNENARKWLEGAMDKERISIELANGIICPIKSTGLEEGGPEICHNYSGGFPNEIVELINSCDGQVIEKEELLRTFDEVVRDNSGANKFWTEIDDEDAILVNQIEADQLQLLEGITIPLENILNEKVLYFVDDEKNLEGYERILTNHEKNFAEVMEILLKRIFIMSHQTQYNLDSILQQLIGKKPKDLSWGRALLEIWDNEHILIMLPPKNHNLAIVKGNDQEETILLSVDTKKLVEKKILQIDYQRNPDIIYWKRVNSSNDLTYVRTKNLPYVDIKDRANPIDQWNFSPFIIDSFLFYNQKYGWNWAEIEENFEYEIDNADLRSRLNPIFIDGLYSDEKSYSVHNGRREIDRFGDIEPIYRPKKPFVHLRDGKIDKKDTDNTIPWQLLIASVNKKQDWEDRTMNMLYPSPVRDYRTERGSPIPVFSNDEYYGGIIRILGSFSMIMDRIKVNELEDLLEKIHLISYYKQKMNEKQISIAHKAYAFDSMWVKGHTEELGIIGKYIPRSNVNFPKYIGDDDEERTRKHGIFNSLDSENVSGFRETKLNYEPVNFNRKTFNHKKWLPRIDTTKPEDYTVGHFDIYWTNLICVKLHTEQEIREIFSNQQIDAGLRSGVERLIEVILDDDRNNSEEALEWLNELIKIGMPTRGWLGRTVANRRTSVKVSLREKIEYEGWEDRFEDLYNEVSTQNSIQWRDLESAIRTGATSDRILDEFGDVQIPTLQPGEINWVSQEDRGIKVKHLRSSGANRTKLIVKNDTENYPLKLFANESDVPVCVVKERRILRGIQQIHNFNEITDEMYKILKTDIDTSNNPEVTGNKNLEYITKMLSGLESDYNEIRVKWYDYSARNSPTNTGFPFTSSEGCIAIDSITENGDLIINISDTNIDGILDMQTHEWISKWLIDLLDKEYGFSKDDVILSIENNKIISPWYWLIPDLGTQNGEEKDDFIREYCPNLLTLRELMKIPKIIEGTYENNPVQAKNDLFAYFEKLVNMYKDNEAKLENSHNGMEKEFYEDVPSIVTDWIYSNPSVNNTTTVDRKINIGYWMLENRRKEVTSKIQIEAMGTILYVNYSEKVAFESYISNRKRQGSGHAYDFSEYFYDNLWKKIITEGIDNEEWFINERGGIPETIIEIPEMFISNYRELKSGSLHKIHALHILAYLTALKD